MDLQFLGGIQMVSSLLVCLITNNKNQQPLHLNVVSNYLLRSLLKEPVGSGKGARGSFPQSCRVRASRLLDCQPHSLLGSPGRSCERLPPCPYNEKGRVWTSARRCTPGSEGEALCSASASPPAQLHTEGSSKGPICRMLSPKGVLQEEEAKRPTHDPPAGNGALLCFHQESKKVCRRPTSSATGIAQAVGRMRTLFSGRPNEATPSACKRQTRPHWRRSTLIL